MSLRKKLNKTVAKVKNAVSNVCSSVIRVEDRVYYNGKEVTDVREKNRIKEELKQSFNNTEEELKKFMETF